MYPSSDEEEAMESLRILRQIASEIDEKIDTPH